MMMPKIKNVILSTFVDAPGISPRSCKVTHPPPWLLSPRAKKKMKKMWLGVPLELYALSAHVYAPDLLT